MMNLKNLQHHSKFNLKGCFLGFIRKGSQFKYLRLAVAKEEFQIKLSRESRASCQAALNPNVWIRVTGEMSVCSKTGDLKLKAERIIILDQISSLPKIADSSFITSIPNQASIPSLTERPTNPPKLTLLMCKKSGCQKKGASKQRQAIEKLLCDRNLRDQVIIQETGCLGKCSMAPNLMLMPGQQRLSGMTSEAIVALLTRLSSKILSIEH